MKLSSVLAVASLGLAAATTEPELDENIVRILSAQEDGQQPKPSPDASNKERDLQGIFIGVADDDVCCLDWQYECFGQRFIPSKGKGGMMMGRLLMMGSKGGVDFFPGFCEWVCVEECEDPDPLPPPPARPPMCWPTESFTDPDGCGCDCQCCEVGAGLYGHHGGFYGGGVYGKGFYGKGFGKGFGRRLEGEGEGGEAAPKQATPIKGSSVVPSDEAKSDNKERELFFNHPSLPAPFTCDCSCECEEPPPPPPPPPPLPPIYYYSKKGKGGMMMGMMGMMGGGYYYGGGGYYRGGMMMGMMGGGRYFYDDFARFDDFIIDDYY